ncbi:MAG: YhbY family RNA-binding protein [Deltaproteobacteria bacterium]|nr:MAG: YhbY family RNA-binding protein [Deltaproteobacteria bacterium]
MPPTADSSPPRTPPHRQDEDSALPDPQSCRENASGLGSGRLVALCSPDRTGAQRRHLRGLGHRLQPTVQIGHQGLHPGIASALRRALLEHELIKVRLLDTCPEDHGTCALWIHAATQADVVQILGRTMLVYAPHPEKPRIRLPGA